MLHDDSFITGLLIGDKRGYDRGYEEGGGGTSQSRDTIEFGDGMTVDIWKVPHYFDAPNLPLLETEFRQKCFMASLRAGYCCAVLMSQYGFKATFSSVLDPRFDPTYEPQQSDWGKTWVYINPETSAGSTTYEALASADVETDGGLAIEPWAGDMWFVVTATFIGCITKLKNYNLPVIWWAFVYAQNKDGGEWRPWYGEGIGTNTYSYSGLAGDLSSPPTHVEEKLDVKQLQVNLSTGALAQVDNFWVLRNTDGILLDAGNVKIDPNFASVGTSTKHQTTGRRLLYLAHTGYNGGGAYPYIYVFDLILLPKSGGGAVWHGLIDRSILESFTNGTYDIPDAVVGYDAADISSENTPNSYYAGYNAGYEAGLAGGGGDPDDGSYDEGYQAGYQAGYAAGLAAGGDDDGYTLHPAPDGATELTISIEAVALRALQLCFCQTVSGGVSINWGDGSATETVSGTGAVYPTHNYNSNGEYVIRLLPAEGCEMTLGGGTAVAKTVFNDGTGVAAGRGVVLKKAVVGDGVSTVGRYAFRNSWNLEEVYVSDGVEMLGQSCFQECPGLHRIRLPSTLTSLSLGSEFSGCYGISEINIPASVTAIGTNTFSNCQSLKKIGFTGITSISASALGTCRGLQRVDLPATLTTLAYNFAGSTINLREIHIAATTPPTLNGNLSIPSGCVVYIPAGSLATYSATNYWKNIAARLIEE